MAKAIRAAPIRARFREVLLLTGESRSVSGPEYAQVFTANVMLGESDEIISTGTGTSKRKAQLAAAEEGWKALDNRKSEAQNVRKHRKHHHKHGNNGNDSNDNK